jgi:hypothetical protein
MSAAVAGATSARHAPRDVGRSAVSVVRDNVSLTVAAAPVSSADRGGIMLCSSQSDSASITLEETIRVRCSLGFNHNRVIRAVGQWRDYAKGRQCMNSWYNTAEPP